MQFQAMILKRKIFFWLFGFWIGCISPLYPAGAKKLLVLGIDGCRPDALLRCNVPNLRSLAETGAYTWYALSRPPTKSGPCWSSIFTGVWNDKHGVTDNTFANSHFDQYPMLFQRLRNFIPDFSSGWFVYWPDLATRMPHGASFASGDWSDAHTLEKAKAILTEENTDAVFVHFGGIDAMGHTVGFDPNYPQYLAAIEKVDFMVGDVLSVLRARPHYYEEDWLIIALTDHGGFQTHHGGSTIEEMRIFFIVSGNGIPHREFPSQWVENEKSVCHYGIALDGVDDAIGIPDTSFFHFDFEKPFTLELHVQTLGWSGERVLLANKDVRSKESKGFAVLLIDEGKWRVHVADGEKSKNISGPVISDGVWHHLAIVFDENKKLKIYQDGIFTGAMDISNLKKIEGDSQIVIGQDPLFSRPEFAPVKLNEIRIWSTALSDSLLQEWIFTPLTEAHPQFEHLIGYWKLEKDSLDRILDSGPYGLHAQFFGGTPQWIFPHDTVRTLGFDSCQAVKTVDLMPMVLSHFGIPILPEWGLDGKIMISLDTSIQDVRERLSPKKPLGVEVWPNPLHGQCHLQSLVSGNARVELYDILGRKIAVLYTGVLSPEGISLNFSNFHLSTGLYLLRVIFPEKSLLIKITILH